MLALLMPIAYIALGSNLGNREQSLRLALAEIEKLPTTRILAIAPFLETDPVDAPPNSPRFINTAAALDTQLPPTALLQSLLAVEKSLGRERTPHQPKNQPRNVDLDLLLHGDTILNDPGLTLPHPRMHQRRFVLEPLAAIAPDIIHPITRQTVLTMLQQLKDPH
jgi:2-amino-4-hydroxy-6-hydroxymethyldihydropteridine diphosphokinase